MGLVKQLGQRFAFYFARTYRLTVFVSGLALEVVAIAKWEDWQPWSSVLAVSADLSWRRCWWASWVRMATRYIKPSSVLV